MRILHIIESLELGGAEKVVVTLANAMAQRHEVSVCCARRIGDLAKELSPTIPVYCLRGRNGNDYRLPFRLTALARRERFDIIHSHNWSLFVEAAVAGAWSKTPALVHTVHGAYLAHRPTLTGALKRSVRHHLERRMAHRFRRVATVSNEIARYVLQEVGLPADKVVTVHNGIADTPALPGRPKAGTGQGVTFITTGRLALVKNHSLLLRAFGLVVRSDPRARLVIVGDGPEREALAALTQGLELGSAVSFLGFRTDVRQQLAQADVFVLTSRYEGISIALLEAMQTGLPAVTTRVGGLPEMIVDGVTGLLVEPDDAEGIAAAMLRLAASPELRSQMGQRGRALQASQFSLRAMVERYLQIYGAAPSETAA
jgi:glycosyltransferase involved in cell wall biosynthesis